ncbi:MAG TPA: hypothetical protein VF920_11205 [Dongiaceae bacterium]
MSFKKSLLGLTMLSLVAGAASANAADLKLVGISVGSLGNPFFVATINGITA